jgi:mono/diheme cytochrome c family protein
LDDVIADAEKTQGAAERYALDGFAPDPTTHFVLRSVPHTLSLATSVTNPAGAPPTPANRTGWSGDGAPGAGALRDFQTGAITQHYTKSLARVRGTDFRLAVEGELDRIDHFMRQLGRLNELNLATVVLNDAGAEAGRQRFLNVGCNACHGNAGANASFAPGNRNFNTGVESARNAELALFSHDGGFLASPANPDGSFGDGTFNTPPLIEAADTGPFFHTATTVSGASAHNTAVATTIEEAIAFYDRQHPHVARDRGQRVRQQPHVHDRRRSGDVLNLAAAIDDRERHRPRAARWRASASTFESQDRDLSAGALVSCRRP